MEQILKDLAQREEEDKYSDENRPIAQHYVFDSKTKGADNTGRKKGRLPGGRFARRKVVIRVEGNRCSLPE